MTAKSEFNPYVHGARGLFCLMVFVFHVANSGLPTFGFAETPAMNLIFHSLQAGVEFFFGISGFVILTAMARSKSVASFMWNRFTRIYPVLWATIVCILVMTVAANAPMPGVLTVLFSVFVPPPVLDTGMINPAAWSLQYETTLYGLIALAWIFRGWDIKIRLTLLGLIGLGFLIVFPRAWMMVVGVLLVAGKLDSPVIDRFSRWPLAFMIVYLLAWQGLAEWTNTPTLVLNPYNLGVQWFGVFPLIIGIHILGGLALVGVVRGYGNLGKFLSTGPMQWMGTISYSFYLWHAVIMAIVKRLMHMSGAVERLGDMNQIVFAVLSLPVSIFVAWVSYNILEKKLTKYLRGRTKPRLAPNAGYPTDVSV